MCFVNIYYILHTRAATALVTLHFDIIYIVHASRHQHVYFIYICIYIYIYMYIYIHTYIHIYIHRKIPQKIKTFSAAKA